MPYVPAWIMIAFALLSAHFVSRQQGVAFAIPRFYVALMYIIITFEMLGSPANNNAVYVMVNRYGYIFIFLVDIIPAIVLRWQKMRKK